jgi:undecaprenyl-diphosphatase
VAGCLCCVAGLLAIWVLAYYVAPFEQLDETVLNAISTPSGSLVHDLAFAVQHLVDPICWIVAAALAYLLALLQSRRDHGLFAVAQIAGTAVLVLSLKLVFEHDRPLSIPADEFEWSPIAKAYPSGNSAGALALAMAFLATVPDSWKRPTAFAGGAFALAVGGGLLVLNYHYPSDILGGWLVALGWCFALMALDADRKWTRSGAGR